MTEKRTSQLAAVWIGVLLLVVALAVGGLAGAIIGAAQTGDRFRGAVSVLTSPTGDAAKTFNWLIFIIFAAAGFVAFSACVAASLVLPKGPGRPYLQQADPAYAKPANPELAKAEIDKRNAEQE